MPSIFRALLQRKKAAATEAVPAPSFDALYAMAHYNRALLMQDCSRWDEVLASYDHAIAIDPGFADAQYNRGLEMPDWRWLRDREDSPWYPTVRLYRQTAAGDWNPALARVAADLQREFSIA